MLEILAFFRPISLFVSVLKDILKFDSLNRESYEKSVASLKYDSIDFIESVPSFNNSLWPVFQPITGNLLRLISINLD